MQDSEPLIPAQGGYRKLRSFQIARLCYDVTVRFCDRFIDRRSRTHDQMVQAARSGVQNIAEGSCASGTSRRTELKLTNVARASLEELRLDYEDFLRQRGFHTWPPDHPALLRFKARRCATLKDFREWVAQELRQAPQPGAQTHTDPHGRPRTEGGLPGSPLSVAGPCPSVPVRVPSAAELAANGALSLLNLCCHLLDRQLQSQARAFLEQGGFTERLYRTRQARRSRDP